MLKSLSHTVVALLMITTSCNFPTATSTQLDGYANLKFGSGWTENVASTGLDLFDSARLQSCQIDLPVRGCLLLPRDNLTTFRSIGGIPYGLGLAFNRFDKLTDIHLKFSRDETESQDEKISSSDCLTIHERTLDWLTKDYGIFLNKNELREKNYKTKDGNIYSTRKSKFGNFLTILRKNFSDGREIFLLSYYVTVGSNHICNIDINFSEVASVERWMLAPDAEDTLQKVIKQTTQDGE